jgi:toxin YoeB
MNLGKIIFTGNKLIKKSYTKLINSFTKLREPPFEGLGKPEPLRYQLQGCWSRRINDEHRIIYEVIGDTVRIIACRYHY